MSLALRAEEALGAFPPKVLKALLDCLQDPDGRVRTASADSIVKVALPDDARVISAVAERMLHEDGEVRRASSATLVRLAIKFGEVDDPSRRSRDPEASPLWHIERLVNHPSDKVQRAAVEAMEAICSPGNSLYDALADVVTSNHDAIAKRQAEKQQRQVMGLHMAPVKSDRPIIPEDFSCLVAKRTKSFDTPRSQASVLSH